MSKSFLSTTRKEIQGIIIALILPQYAALDTVCGAVNINRRVAIVNVYAGPGYPIYACRVVHLTQLGHDRAVIMEQI